MTKAFKEAALLATSLTTFSAAFLMLEGWAFAQFGGVGPPISIPEDQREYQVGRNEAQEFWQSREGREWRESIQSGDCNTSITCAKCRDAALSEATSITEFPTQDNQRGKREFLGEKFGCSLDGG